MKFKKMSFSIVSTYFRALERLAELVGTLLYRELLKRNTIRPMNDIVKEPDPNFQRRLLRQWAQKKANESSYIQLAGGFLFTTVASCLQWPGTQNGHWSATAFFYACMLLALVAIVMGSQQLQLLPNEKRQEVDEGLETSIVLQSRHRNDQELKLSEKQYLQAIVRRLSTNHHNDRPNGFQIFALQAPMMLLAFSVIAFLAGLCSIVFAPLGQQLEWDNNAKIAVVFSVVGVLCVIIFFSVSFLMHQLFSLQLDDACQMMHSMVTS